MSQVMTLPKEVAEAVLGTALQPLLQQRTAGRSQAGKSQVSRPQIEYHDLEMHRVVGTGQFGKVRVVRHIPTNQAYALKVNKASNFQSGLLLCWLIAKHPVTDILSLSLFRYCSLTMIIVATRNLKTKVIPASSLLLWLLSTTATTNS